MTGAIRIGTRGSRLARWQAEWVAAQLRRHRPDRDVTLVEIQTRGDRDQNSPLAAGGGIGVFTKELQRALLEGTIDVAVRGNVETRLDQALRGRLDAVVLAEAGATTPGADPGTSPSEENMKGSVAIFHGTFWEGKERWLL